MDPVPGHPLQVVRDVRLRPPDSADPATRRTTRRTPYGMRHKHLAELFPVVPLSARIVDVLMLNCPLLGESIFSELP